MTIKTLTLLSVISLSAFVVTVNAADEKLPAAADKKDVTFEKDIKPIFEHACVKCHGAEKQKGGLRVDSLAATLKGSVHKDGSAEKVVEVGNSAKSSLVLSVAHIGDDEDHFMPKGKDAKPLTAEQIGLIRAWIDQGAK